MESFADDLVAIERIDAVPRILEVVCRATGMGFAAVARVTEDRWIACAVRDEIAFGLEPGGELRVETTICNEIRQHGQVVVIDDVAGDELFCRHPTPQLYGFRSYISVPITVGEGGFFGTLCAIDPRPARVNTRETISMFNLFAELIAFHLDARDRVTELEARVASRTVALRQLNVRLERIREDESARIARELHDELGQGLTALKLDIDAARTALTVGSKDGRTRTRDAIESMAVLTDAALDSVERIVSELRPAVLDALGVAAAVEWLVDQFARRTAIRTTCHCDDLDITPATATALFRIAQEALTNVSRHARASEVSVVLRREDGHAVLVVTDNGCGIPDSAMARPTAHGLRGMRERLEALSGSLAVTSVPDGGTRLVARCRLMPAE